MSAYIARRILLMIPTLLGILFVSFVVVQFAPGGREHDAAPLLLEQGRIEGLGELLQLGGNGRLREVKRFGGADIAVLIWDAIEERMLG